MLSRILSILGCAALCSCASVSVTKIQYLDKQPPKRAPQQILVKPLGYFEPNLAVDRSGTKLSDFKYEFQEKLTRNLVQRLPEYVAPARAIAATAPARAGNAWLITGQFDRVEQGSRLLRSLVGFGSGATKLQTTIIVSDLSGPSPRPFLLIQTSGGTNAAPMLVGTTRAGLTFDAIRTSREICATLSEYLYQQGIIPYENAVGPKRAPGVLPVMTPGVSYRE